MGKRWLSGLLILCMVFTMNGMTVLAAEGDLSSFSSEATVESADESAGTGSVQGDTENPAQEESKQEDEVPADEDKVTEEETSSPADESGPVNDEDEKETSEAGEDEMTPTEETATADAEDVVTDAQVGSKSGSVDMYPKYSLAAGGSHAGVIKNDGSLWVCGYNKSGELGDGADISHYPPYARWTFYQIMTGVESVEYGGWVSLILRKDGSLWATGQNNLGQLGIGTTENTSTPVKVMDDVVSMSTSGNQSAAIKSDGSLWMWGDNSWGELGTGNKESSLVPVKIMDDVASVACGGYMTSALKSDGTVWSWGDKNYIGAGEREEESLYPVKVMDDVSMLTCGAYTSAAIKADGSLWVWGDSYYANLPGLGTGYVLDPTKVMDDVKTVSMGNFFMAAVKKDNSLWTCGYNGAGQVGNGTVKNVTSFVKIKEDIVNVVCGQGFCVALDSSRNIWTWGDNTFGQLGNEQAGSYLDVTSPKIVGSTIILSDGESGKCGDNLEWSIAEGVLRISGEGSMYDYSTEIPSPFKSLTFTECIIEDGVTTIGDYAFSQCAYLKEITIPNSVKVIGDYAFSECSQLSEIELPAVEKIEGHAFYKCSALNKVSLSDSLKELGNYIFYRCDSLEHVLIPASVRKCGMYTFRDTSTVIQCYRNSYVLEYIIEENKMVNISYEIIDDRFNYDNNIYNEELNQMCAMYSAYAYEDYAYNSSQQYFYNNTSKGKRLKSLIEGNSEYGGYRNVFQRCYGDKEENNNSYIIGHKKVQTANGVRDMILIVLRGTDGIEWLSNFDVTGKSYNKSGRHASFDAAAKTIEKYVQKYAEDWDLQNSMVLITGHSRGAAVGNMIAYDFTTQAEAGSRLDSNSIYAYTYATPNGVNFNIEEKDSLRNIYNFCFEDDFAPQMPLKSWGYGKYGITRTVSAQKLLYADSVFSRQFRYSMAKSNETMDNCFNLQKTYNFVKKLYSKCSDVQNYYEDLQQDGLSKKSFYTFFRENVGRAAWRTSDWGTDLKEDIAMKYYEGIKGPFQFIACYFVKDKGMENYVKCNHQMYTYYAAVISNGFWRNGSTEEILDVNSLSIDQYAPLSGEVSSQEKEALTRFANQGDNLEALGWDINDCSTWTGIMWKMGTDNFNHVEGIDFSCMGLTGELDVSGFTELQNIEVSDNLLTSIKFEDCPSLTELYCSNNELTALDIAGYDFIGLDCTDNYLDLSAMNTELDNLSAAGCLLNSAPQKMQKDAVYDNEELEVLKKILVNDAYDLSDNPGQWPGITWEKTEKTYHVGGLNIAGMEMSGELNVSKLKYLTSLNCSDNQYSSLDISGCTKLKYLNCSNCKLETVKTDNSTVLTSLQCAGNYLTTANADELLSNMNPEDQEDAGTAPQYLKAELSEYAEVEYDALKDIMVTLGYDGDKPQTWDIITWEKQNGETFHVTKVNFSRCSEVEGTLDFSKFTYLKDVAFNMCENVTEVTLPESVTALKSHAFVLDSSLSKLTVKGDLTDIDEYAFVNCPKLIIYGQDKSNIQKYAAENGIEFVIDEKEPEKPPVEMNFSDVFEGDWFYEPVKYVFENGYMTGMGGSDRFAPAENLSRAQFACIIHRMEGSPKVEYTEKFPDVRDNEFYTEAVLWANKNGILNGYSNGKFGPADNITREQIAAMMSNYAKYKKYDVSETNNLNGFPDKGKVSSFALDSVRWAVGAGLITGDKGNISPQGNASRAQCASIIMRFVEHYKNN
ncbi:MAG: leucine-rich repeat protein [Lachnospiraceae bacterium]|nr:leucine-rich repeat protein [Lachnospiraceae bacterium]MDD3616656.1 leucine-rich repeat protein [Lachnospiraceae bacterium]